MLKVKGNLQFVSNRRGGILRRASLGQTSNVIAPTADVASADAAE